MVERKLKKPYLGLSIHQDQMSLVLMEGKSVQKFGCKNLIQLFDVGSFESEDEFLNTQIEVLAELYKMIGSGEEVGVSLYSGMVHLKKIPVALGLGAEVIKEQLYWEAEQNLISPLNDYVIEYQRLPFQTSSGNPVFIMVLIRKKIISLIKKLIEEVGLKLVDVDVDIFSNIRSLVTNYNLKGDKLSVLIDVQREYMSFVFIKEQEFFLSHLIPLKNSGKFNDRDISEISKSIKKELRRLIFGHRIGSDIDDLNAVYLTGIEDIHEISERLRKNITVEIDILDPFRNLEIPASISGMEEVEKFPERFTSSIGVALKKSSVM